MKSPAWIFWLFLIANLVFLLALGAHLALDYRSLHSVEKWVADGQEDSRDAELVEQARAMLADDQATEQERHIAGMVLASVSANALRKDELLDQLGSGGGLLRHGLVMLATLLVFSGTLVLLARARRRDRLNALRHDEAVGSFNYLLEKAPLAFVAWNNERGVLLWNEDAERLFGVRRNSVLGAPMPASAKGVAIAVEEAMTEGSSAVTMELDLGARQDLSMVVAVVATRMQSADGTPTYSAVIEDLTSQRQQEQRRLAVVRQQRDALVREVHHRIKNHLQGVAGLLRQHLGDKPLLQPLLESATAQVLTIAAVHGLHGELEGGALDLLALLTRISSSISTVTHAPIVLEQSSQLLGGARVAEEETVPVAMIINEVIMNAVKHRVRNGPDGVIRISAASDGDEVRIIISNQGFLPPRFDLDLGSQVGNGLSLAKSLMPTSGSRLSLQEHGERVITTFELAPPVLLPGGPDAQFERSNRYE